MRTRSKTKKIRENVRRLPHEVEATLPSWVKCTDPIPREILEEVRSTVLVWMKNVKNYVEEAETYILNDEHTHQEIVDDEWAFFVASYLCRDPLLFCPFPNTGIPSPPWTWGGRIREDPRGSERLGEGRVELRLS